MAIEMSLEEIMMDIEEQSDVLETMIVNVKQFVDDAEMMNDESSELRDVGRDIVYQSKMMKNSVESMIDDFEDAVSGIVSDSIDGEESGDILREDLVDFKKAFEDLEDRGWDNRAYQIKGIMRKSVIALKKY